MTRRLYDFIAANALKRPRAVLFVDAASGEDTTYDQFNILVEDFSDQLVSKGLAGGERVGILSRNSVRAIAAFFAASNAGGSACWLNHSLDTASIIDTARDCAVSALYVGQELRKDTRAIVEGSRSVKFMLEDALSTERGSGHPPGTDDRPAPAAIVYTAGSTGKPLGVMLSHENLISNAEAVASYAGITARDRGLCVLPMCYIYGLSFMLSHLVSGASIVLENRFAYPQTAVESMERFKVTGFAGVSSHYAILLDNTDISARRLPSLRYMMQAGDAMPGALALRLAGTFPKKKIFLMYGQTEASPRLTYLDPGLVQAKPCSVGKAAPGVTVRVVDARGNERKAGEPGEVIARGPNVMRGYWGHPEETKKAIRRGWLHTGDIGYKDSDGDLFVTGRLKSFVKVGGRKADLSVIERAAAGIEGVSEAAAIAVADKLLGARIRLFVSAAKGARLDARGVTRSCKRLLPPHMVPSRVVVLEAMPKNIYGKTDRKALQDIR